MQNIQKSIIPVFNQTRGTALNSLNPLSIADELSTTIQGCRNINVSVKESNILAGAFTGAAIGLAADRYFNTVQSPNMGYPLVGAVVSALVMGLLTR